MKELNFIQLMGLILHSQTSERALKLSVKFDMTLFEIKESKAAEFKTVIKISGMFKLGNHTSFFQYSIV